MSAATEIDLRRLEYDRLHAFSALFTTYCTDYDALADHYAGDFRAPEARAEAVRRALGHARDRDALADVLIEQNERWGGDAAVRAHIEALRDDETVAVVTGQQVGLFGGPLYTVLKTLTAIQLARRVEAETGKKAVPVFWLAGEDHDLEEVVRAAVLRGNEPVHLHYTGHALPAEGNLGPVGRLAFTEQIAEVVDRLGEALAPTDFHDDLMAAVRAAYRPGATMTDAFAGLLRHFFPEAGLVFVSGDDARLKRLSAGLFRREIEDFETASARFDAASARLEARYHAQVKTRPLNLFLLDDDGRRPLDATGDGFRLRGTDRTYGRGELLALLEASPERFSPNVVLRPVMQDHLFPTVAYVAGPGEVAYFAQLRPVYAWAGVPMPLIHPRASLTIVEHKVEKVLDRYEIGLPDLHDDLDRLFDRLVRARMAVDVEAVFDRSARHLHEAVDAVKPEAESVDRTLGKSAEATRAALLKEWERLKGRVVKAEKRNQDEVRAQLEKAYVNLMPGGKPQERVVSALYFLNKYGPGFLSMLDLHLSLDTTAHQVLAL